MRSVSPRDAHQALAALLKGGKRRDGSPLTGDDRVALATHAGAARWMEGYMERKGNVKAKAKASGKKSSKEAQAWGGGTAQDAAPMIQAAQEEAAVGKVLGPVLALLSAAELKELGEWVERSKLSAAELAARGLQEGLARERERLAKVLPRPRLMAEEMVRSYGQAIFKAVKDATDREWDWVVVDYNTRTVEAQAKYPAGANKGIVALSVRAEKGDVERWTDLAGVVTEKAVLACLLGFARPPGAPAK